MLKLASFKMVFYKFFFAFNLFIKSKWVFSYPEKKPILLYDHQFILDGVYKKKTAILYKRGEEINIPVLLHCLKEFDFSFHGYLLRYINFVEPKVIVSFLSQYPKFYFLSKQTGITTILFQYGNMAYLKSFYLKYLKKEEDVFVDYIFLYNKKIQIFFDKLKIGKTIVVGSFKNNKVFFRKKRKKKEVLFVSDYFDSNKNWNILKYDKIVIKHLSKLCLRKSLKFNILLKTGSNKEIDWFNNILNSSKSNSANFIKREKNPFHSYKKIETYNYVFGISSSLLSEAFSKKCRIGIINFRPKKYLNWLPMIKEYGQKKGPFWIASKKINIRKFNKVFNYVINSSNLQWEELYKKYSEIMTNFDHNNKKFYLLLKKILK
jgi:surface carbohydrate biosynthesis protein